MKILLVHKFWKKVGGAEMYFQDTVRILKKNGHQVRVFSTMYDPGGAKDVFPRNDDEVRMGYAPEYLKGGLLSKLVNIPETIYSKRNKKLFTELLDEFKPDLVHVFAIYVTITPSILHACSEKDVPVVMSCNDYKHICPNYRLFHHGKLCEDCKGKKFYKAITNNCCKHSRAVSVVSALEAYVHEWMDLYRGNVHTFLFESDFMLKKTREFWQGHEVRLRFLGKPFDATLQKAGERYDDYVLFIGRLSDEKGVDVLLNAMKLVPEAKLKIAGDGEWSGHLRKMSADAGLSNVEFLGSVWGEDLKDLIRNCRFIVVPSVWHENFPYVMTEGFSSGKAIIGSDRGGIPEYIDHGETGFVYSAYDHQSLAGHIRKLFNDTAMAEQMGRAAKSYADEHFNDAVFYERLLKIYSDVLNVTPKNTEIAAD